MKNILFIILLIGSISASEFEDKYYKCTLIVKDKKNISQRLADTWDKSNLGLVITREELLFEGASCRLGCQYKYTSPERNIDVYSLGMTSAEYFFDEKSMRYFEVNPQEKDLTIYQCVDATFFERSIMKSKVSIQGIL